MAIKLSSKSQGGGVSDLGYSLMEMLVVLVILALLLSVGGVRLITSLESAQFERRLDFATAEFVAWRADAVLDHRPVRVQPSAPENIGQIRRFDIPGDWQAIGREINIDPAGYCYGGEVEFMSADGRRALYQFNPPDCTPTRLR